MKSFALAMASATLFADVSAHVSANPNTAPAGAYTLVNVKVPHGVTDHETTKVVIKIPDGVLSVTPEVVPGWTPTVDIKSVTPWDNHGTMVDTAPSQVTYQASAGSGVHAKHLQQFGLQIKFGCTYKDAASSTKWQDEHTLWFPVTQYVSLPGSLAIVDAQTLSWTGIPQGNDASWNSATPKPSPYVFISAWSACKHGNMSGMMWFGSHLHVQDKAAEAEAALVQKIKTLSNEQVLNAHESLPHGDTDIDERYEVAASVALSLSCINTVLVVLLLAMVLTGWNPCPQRKEKCTATEPQVVKDDL